MLNSILVAALVALGGDSQARFHPPAPDLYLEIPDISRLLEGYGEAPVIQLIRDEELRETVFDLLEQSGVDAQRYLRPAFENLDLPGDLAIDPGTLIVAGLSQVARVSVSVSLPAGRPVTRVSDLTGLAICEFASPVVAGVAAKAVLEQLAPSVREGEEVELFNLDGAEARLIPIPADLLGVEGLWIATSGSLVVLGLGIDPAVFMDRALGEAASLAEEERFGRLRGELGGSEGAPVFDVFRTQTLAGLVAGGAGTFLPPEVTQFLSAHAADGQWSSLTSMRLEGDRFVTELVTHAGGRDPGLGILGSGPLNGALFDAVPEDAVGIFAASLDADALHRTLLEGLGSEEARQGPGLDLEKDFLGAMGSNLVLYLLPVNGIGPPRLHALIDLENAATFDQGLTSLLAVIGGLVPEGGIISSVKSKPYRDVPVHTVTFALPAQLAMVALAPTVAIFEDRALLTMTPSAARIEIKSQLKEETRGHAFLEGVALSESSTQMGYMDWGGLFESVYESVRALIGSPLLGLDLPFDPEELPEAEVLIRYFRPTVLRGERREGVTHTRLESSFGPEVPLGLVIAGAVGEQIANNIAASRRPPPNVMAVTRQSLSRTAMAVALYRRAIGAPPAELSDLLKRTSANPGGFLAEADLLRDGWGHPLAYRVLPGGTEIKLWSLGPDGIDQDGGGDDIGGF